MSKVVYSQRWEWQTRLPFPSLAVYKIKIISIAGYSQEKISLIRAMLHLKL